MGQLSGHLGAHPRRRPAPLRRGPAVAVSGQDLAIVSRDTARLLEFLAAAFDAEELARLEGPDGSIEHAEARIGDAVVLAFDLEAPSATPAFLRLFVEDCAATFERALLAGADVVTVPTELAFGATIARVRDPLGNVWWLQQQLADVRLEEYARRAAEPRFVEAMAYVQSAELVPR
jgi:uncharacterized glyoxalase superfamily protein PhnB